MSREDQDPDLVLEQLQHLDQVPIQNVVSIVPAGLALARDRYRAMASLISLTQAWAWAPGPAAAADRDRRQAISL